MVLRYDRLKAVGRLCLCLLLGLVGLAGVILFPEKKAGFYGLFEIGAAIVAAAVFGPHLIGGQAIKLDANGLELTDFIWRRRRYALQDISAFVLKAAEPNARDQTPSAICRLHGGSLYLTGQDPLIKLPRDLECSPVKPLSA